MRPVVGLLADELPVPACCHRHSSRREFGVRVTPDLEETRRLVGELTGFLPAELSKTSSPDAWFAELDGRSVVVKRPGWRNRPGGVRVEAWAYAACANHGVSVPRVLALSEDPECLVLERLAGVPLERGAPLTEDVRAIWAWAGADLRAIHEISLSGFGPLVPSDGQPHGEAMTWSPFVEYAEADGIPWLVDAGYIDPTAGDRLLQRFGQALPIVRRLSDGRLLHGDLQSLHIVHAQPGGYQGIIDFGQAQAGDPRWDLARVPLWDGEVGLDVLLDGYGHDVVTPEDREFLLPLYRLAFVIKGAVGHSMPDYIRLVLDRSGYKTLL